MKYLSHYLNDEVSRIFKKYGAFFAFGNKQFNENKKDGVKYANVIKGLFCPAENVKMFMDEYEKAYKKALDADLAEHGKKNIIWREFANYECQITMNYEEVIDVAAGYGITADEVKEQWALYYQHYKDNDYF